MVEERISRFNLEISEENEMKVKTNVKAGSVAWN